MKATFRTSTENLKSIIEDTKTIKYDLQISNYPIYRFVKVTITANEDEFNQFMDINELWSCIGEIS